MKKKPAARRSGSTLMCSDESHPHLVDVRNAHISVDGEKHGTSGGILLNLEQ